MYPILQIENPYCYIVTKLQCDNIPKFTIQQKGSLSQRTLYALLTNNHYEKNTIV